MSKSFNIADLELIDVANLIIMDATGENELQGDVGIVSITAYGQGSPQFVKAKYKLDNATAASFAAMVGKKGGQGNRAEESAKNAAEFLAACTKSLNNLPITPLELYSNPKLKYIADQFDKWLGEASNFMPSSQAK